MKILVITPNFNSGHLLLETVSSVLKQQEVDGSALQFRYIIQDGGSPERDLEPIRQLVQHDSRVELRSEPDRGMYDAIATALQAEHCDVVCWLNAGDLWMPWTLRLVRLVFSEFRNVDWITGFDGYFSDSGEMILSRWPPRYKRSLLRTGTYAAMLPAVQQETTFWRRSLMFGVDMDRFAKFRLAGDAYLWSCFARTAELYMVRAVLGGFRYHGGHLSDAKERYRSEMRSFSERSTVRTFAEFLVEWLLWKSPDSIKLFTARRTTIQFDKSSGRWHIRQNGPGMKPMAWQDQ